MLHMKTIINLPKKAESASDKLHRMLMIIEFGGKIRDDILRKAEDDVKNDSKCNTIHHI